MRLTFVLLGMFFAVSSCSRHVNRPLSKTPVLDSLKTIIDQVDAKIEFLADNIPNVLQKDTVGKSNIFLLEPFGLKIKITSHRPNFSNEIFLVIPAAFTSKTNTIDGLFIENGFVINPTTNKKLNGICIISKDSIKITSAELLNPEMISFVQRNKISLFQQILLVNDSQIVNCNLFGQKENFRRALIQLNNRICVGESRKASSIKEFQESLLKIGAVNAIYLDMGTWSEGWYKNYNREKVVIGEKMTDTDKQTNWLIFEKSNIQLITIVD